MINAAESDAVVTLRREMGMSHAEFFRSLPAAMGEQAFSICGSTVTAENGSRRLIISLAPEQERRIALLRLPVTWVIFDFTGYSEAEVEAFMRRFERHYQRGGG
jgi:hypothetical protein